MECSGAVKVHWYSIRGQGTLVQYTGSENFFGQIFLNENLKYSTYVNPIFIHFSGTELYFTFDRNRR